MADEPVEYIFLKDLNQNGIPKLYGTLCDDERKELIRVLQSFSAICIDSVIVLRKDTSFIISWTEYLQNYKDFESFVKSYRIENMGPSSCGRVTDRTVIVMDNKCTRQDDLIMSPIKNSYCPQMCFHDNIFQSTLRLRQQEKLMLAIKPSRDLFGFDTLIVMPSQRMYAYSITEGAPLYAKSRQLFAVPEKNSFISSFDNPFTFDWQVFDRTESDVGFVSQALFFNLGCPDKIELSKFRSPQISSELSSSVTLHPINKCDPHKSSISLALQCSIEAYIKRLKGFISWTHGDVIVLEIARTELFTAFELECARARDLTEYFSSMDNGKYAYFRVENSGTADASVLLGATIVFSGEDFNLLIKGPSSTLLPIIPPKKSIAFQPSFGTLLQHISEMHDCFLNDILRGSSKKIFTRCQLLVLGCEENNILGMLSAACYATGRQPIHIPAGMFDNVTLSDIAKYAAEDFTNTLIFSLSAVVDDTELFFDKFFDIADSYSDKVPIIIYFDGVNCPLFYRNRFRAVTVIKNPNAEERIAYIHFLLKKDIICFPSEEIALLTNGMSVQDIQTCIPNDITADFWTLDALRERISSHRKHLGWKPVSVKNVQWKDIGGLHEQKRTVLKHITMPIKFPHLFIDRKPSGILFYGPPGCGKTLFAKAIASELNVSFISVKGPELLNMYVGQSEKNIREIFVKARESSPCVIFFDEIDSIAPSRQSDGDGSVMARIVSQLLLELDGISSENQSIFCFGATNRIDLIDKSLLRPGRFDFAIHLGPPTTKAEISSMLEAILRKLTLASDVDISALASAIFKSKMLTGADMYGIVSNALIAAYEHRGSFTLHQEHLLSALENVD